MPALAVALVLTTAAGVAAERSAGAPSAPLAVQRIPDQELVAPGDAVELRLSAHFSGEDLSFTARSDRPAVAAASIMDDRLVVTANAAGREGVARVTVEAAAADERATLGFDVAVTASPPGIAASWRTAVLEVARLDLPIGPPSIPLLDALPAAGAAVEPGTQELHMVHLGSAAAAFNYTGTCRPNGTALRRSLVGLSGGDLRIIDHHLQCRLEANASQAVTVAIEEGADQFEATLEFATTAASAGPSLRVLATSEATQPEVNGLFRRYVEESLLDDIDSRLARIAAQELLDQLARRTWRDLRSPGGRYGVVAQRVAYVSETPSGERSAALTGLVAMPDVAGGDFERRDRVVVLSHATGSTPSAFRFTDTWFVLANMIAGRGYLVIAPDNWGRGEGTSEFPETYLLANRTANNSLDLVRAVLRDPAYRPFHGFRPGGDPATGTLFGYSQGGHSALALWLAMQTRDSPVDVRDLHIGGAPYDLYQTLRGTLQRLAGGCDGNPWCRHVDESVVPYATGRILPGFLAYTPTGLTSGDVLGDGALNADFVTGMLGAEPRYDALKALLQLNSFTNIVDWAGAAASDTRIHLYHSVYDRLVPHANTRNLVDALEPRFDVTFHDGECDSGVYEALYELTSRVGVLHAICGMEVADEVLQALR